MVVCGSVFVLCVVIGFGFMIVVCCVLLDVRWLLFVAWCSLLVDCVLCVIVLFVVCGLLIVVGWFLADVCRSLRIVSCVVFVV